MPAWAADEPAVHDGIRELQAEDGCHLLGGGKEPAAHHFDSLCMALRPPGICHIGVPLGSISGGSEQLSELAMTLVIVDHHQRTARFEHAQRLSEPSLTARGPEIRKSGMHDVYAVVPEGHVLGRARDRYGTFVSLGSHVEQALVGFHSDHLGRLAGIDRKPVTAATAKVHQGLTLPRRQGPHHGEHKPIRIHRAVLKLIQIRPRGDVGGGLEIAKHRDNLPTSLIGHRVQAALRASLRGGFASLEHGTHSPGFGADEETEKKGAADGDSPLRRAITDALPNGTAFCFTDEDDRVHLAGP